MTTRWEYFPRSASIVLSLVAIITFILVIISQNRADEALSKATIADDRARDAVNTITGPVGPVGPAGPTGLKGPTGEDGAGLIQADLIYARVSTYFSRTVAIAQTTAIISLKKVTVGNTGIVTMYLSGFTGMAASTSYQLLSEVCIPDGFKPDVELYFTVRIKRAGVSQVGTLIVYDDGRIGISDIGLTSNFFTSGQGNCGLATNTTISYTLE